MRRIERVATVAALFAAGGIVTLASSLADHASIISSPIVSATLPVAAFAAALAALLVALLVAIISGLLLLTGPAALLTSGAAGNVTKLDTHTALGG